MKRSRSIAWIGGLSVALAFAAGSVSRMRTPGWWVAGTIFTAVGAHDLSYIPLLFATVIVVDTAICFAILWGGYLLWMGVRRKGTGKKLGVGK